MSASANYMAEETRDSRGNHITRKLNGSLREDNDSES